MKVVIKQEGDYYVSARLGIYWVEAYRTSELTRYTISLTLDDEIVTLIAQGSADKGTLVQQALHMGIEHLVRLRTLELAEWITAMEETTA